MLKRLFSLLLLFMACNASAPASNTYLDVNSPEYKKAFMDFLRGTPETPQYKEIFNDLLKNKGFNLVDSTRPPVPVVPPQINNMPPPGLPAQPMSNPVLPPQQIPVQPQPMYPGPSLPSPYTQNPFKPQQVVQPPLSIFSSGLKGVGLSLFDATTNQANNIFSGMEEVIKGTDEVMTENGYQFQRLNSNGRDFLKQIAQTKGAAFAMIPTTGTRVMKRVENFVNDPTYYANPINLVHAFNPFASSVVSSQQLAINDLISKLKSKNAPLHIKLTSPQNAVIFEYLKLHPDIFMYLLRDSAQLNEVLDNPIALDSLLQELDAAKRR